MHFLITVSSLRTHDFMVLTWFLFVCFFFSSVGSSHGADLVPTSGGVEDNILLCSNYHSPPVHPTVSFLEEGLSSVASVFGNMHERCPRYGEHFTYNSRDRQLADGLDTGLYLGTGPDDQRLGGQEK